MPGSTRHPGRAPSTSPSAWEQNYRLVFAEDLMSAPSEEHHRFALEKIFPRLGRVSRSAELTFN